MAEEEKEEQDEELEKSEFSGAVSEGPGSTETLKTGIKEIDEAPRPRARKVEKKVEVVVKDEPQFGTHIFALRTTANREDQVMDFVASNAHQKKFNVYSVIRPHGMRGYIFIEAEKRTEAEQAAFNVPYARGLLPNEVQYKEIEHMLEQVKGAAEASIKKNDIAEIISGPFKREKCRITRIDRAKDEIVVELLEAAVPIPITLKTDSVKVIRRETEES